MKPALVKIARQAAAVAAAGARSPIPPVNQSQHQLRSEAGNGPRFVFPKK